MISISLCMIVKDEEKTLARCLDSVQSIVDEIIIVDTGSIDSTKEIAKRYTNKVYDYKWCDDFSKARNYSFSKATKEYIMWLDADDVVLKEDRKKLKILKRTLDRRVDIVMLKYNLGVSKENIPALSFYRERIIKRKTNPVWKSPIHEAIELNGYVIKENIAITHKKEKIADSQRNLRIFNKMIKENIDFDERQTFYYARELYYDRQYEKAIEQYTKFINMERGWVENKISACIDLYHIYNIQEKKEKAVKYLFKTFEYDIPRAEVCCNVGEYFKECKQYMIAIYWFKEALDKKMDISTGGFYNKDYYDYIPYMELCVCYDALKNYNKAEQYNLLAGKIKPEDIAYLANVEYFSQKNNNK